MGLISVQKRSVSNPIELPSSSTRARHFRLNCTQSRKHIILRLEYVKSKIRSKLPSNYNIFRLKQFLRVWKVRRLYYNGVEFFFFEIWLFKKIFKENQFQEKREFKCWKKNNNKMKLKNWPISRNTSTWWVFKVTDLFFN